MVSAKTYQNVMRELLGGLGCSSNTSGNTSAAAIAAATITNSLQKPANTATVFHKNKPSASQYTSTPSKNRQTSTLTTTTGLDQGLSRLHLSCRFFFTARALALLRNSPVILKNAVHNFIRCPFVIGTSKLPLQLTEELDEIWDDFEQKWL